MLSARTALLLLVALATTACISATPPPAPPAPPAPPPEPLDGASEVTTPDPDEISTIVEYWEGRRDAFGGGVDAGLAYVVARNHPQLPYLLEDCRQAWFGGAPSPTFREVATLDAGSIATDPDWMMPVGPLVDRQLGDGLYRMAVAFGYEGVAIADRVSEVHLQVAGDGTVRNFLLCDTAQVQVATVESAGVATGATDPGATATGGTTPGTATGTTTTGTGTTTGGTTTTTPTNPATTVSPVPTVLPTFPFPTTGGTGDGDGDGTASPSPTPEGPSDLDFCGARPGTPGAAGDYTICPG